MAEYIPINMIIDMLEKHNLYKNVVFNTLHKISKAGNPYIVGHFIDGSGSPIASYVYTIQHEGTYCVKTSSFKERYKTRTQIKEELTEEEFKALTDMI